MPPLKNVNVGLVEEEGVVVEEKEEEEEKEEWWWRIQRRCDLLVEGKRR